MLAGLATCSATLDAAPSMLKALAPQNLIVITDFDATLTCGDGPQCHDVLGTAPSLPASLRADFAPLLDFSVPHPPEWHGAKWWERANEILVAHGAPTRAALPALVRDAGLTPRPGALNLLQWLKTRGVPVLIVSAGCTDIVRSFLEQELDAPYTGPISSNQLRWDEAGTLVAVDPSPPCTSLDKDRTCERNPRFFASCSSRRSLLILGDSLSDLDVGTGVDRDATYSVGLLNDLRPPWCDPDEYDARFTAVLRGDRASLDPVTDLLERAEAAAKSHGPSVGF